MHAIIRLKNSALLLTSSRTLHIVFGSIVLFACSQLSIPLQPVPITLQTAGVLFLGLMYSRETAVKAVLLYLAAGAVGLPVFTDFSFGLAKIFGPTGGYLFGFVLSVYVVASLARLPKMKTLPGMFLNSAIGTLVIFIPGLLWLAQFTGFSKVIAVGFMPFIIPGLLKAIALSLAVRAVKKP